MLRWYAMRRPASFPFRPSIWNASESKKNMLSCRSIFSWRKSLEGWSPLPRDTKHQNTCTYLHNFQQPAFSNNSTIQSSSSRYDESTVCTALIIILHRWYTTSPAGQHRDDKTLQHDRSFAFCQQWRDFAHICGMSLCRSHRKSSIWIGSMARCETRNL